MKNKIKLSKLFFLILGLSIICGGLIIWRLFFYSTPTLPPVVIPINSPTPKPTEIIVPTIPIVNNARGESQKEILDFLKSKFPLIEFVPYENKDFKIDYQSPLTLKVTIKNGDRKAIEAAVVAWIKSHGVDPTTHKIEYLTPELSPAL